MLEEQHPSRPAIIPIITRNSQIPDIFTESRAVAILFLEIQRALCLNKCNSTDFTKGGA